MGAGASRGVGAGAGPAGTLGAELAGGGASGRSVDAALPGAPARDRAFLRACLGGVEGEGLRTAAEKLEAVFQAVVGDAPSRGELLLRIRLGSLAQGLDPCQAVKAFKGEEECLDLEEVAEIITGLLPDIPTAEFGSLMSAVFYLGGNEGDSGRYSRSAAVNLVREIFSPDLEQGGDGGEGPDREDFQGVGSCSPPPAGSSASPAPSFSPVSAPLVSPATGDAEPAQPPTEPVSPPAPSSASEGLSSTSSHDMGPVDPAPKGPPSKPNEFSALEGAPTYDLSRIGDFLRASALRQASARSGGRVGDAGQEQEEVLARIDDLTTLAGHHVRVEEFVGELGTVVEALEGSRDAVQAEITAAFDCVRSHVSKLEKDLQSGVKLGMENSLVALRNQHGRYSEIRVDILRAIKMAEAALLDRDAETFVELSRAFKEFAAELLHILVLDLEPCARSNFSDIVDPDAVMAALEGVIATQHLSAPHASSSTTKCAEGAGVSGDSLGQTQEAVRQTEEELEKARGQAAQLQIEVALRGERIAAAVRESQNLRIKTAELESKIQVQAKLHEEELAKIRDQVVEQVRGEFAEQQAEFERRLEAALTQSETALLRDSPSNTASRPKSGAARAPRTKPLARPMSASVVPTPTAGVGTHMPLWLPEKEDAPEPGVSSQQNVMAAPRGVRRPQGLAFGASSRRFGSDGALGRLSMQGQRLTGRTSDA